MVEPPFSWDLLTASIAVADLSKPNLTWAFLALEGLVRDAPGDREFFAQAVAEELDNQITGPSTARRVSHRLDEAGIALAAGQAPDPWGKLAATRLAEVEKWTGGRDASEYLEQLAKWGH